MRQRAAGVYLVLVALMAALLGGVLNGMNVRTFGVISLSLIFALFAAVLYKPTRWGATGLSLVFFAGVILFAKLGYSLPAGAN